VDLGLAKVTREGLLSRPPWSIGGRVVGSFHYLSPEQVLGEDVDARADLYAVGVVLFELLTRTPPFVGSEYEILNGHVERQAALPSALAPDKRIPERLDALTLRALAKSPDDRFATAIEFDTALVELLRGAGVDVQRSPTIAGCGEVRASLEAWSNFEHERALVEAEHATQLDERWSPLALLLEIAHSANG